MKFSDNLYYIVPNKLKESILEKISLIDNIYDIHFDTLDEFMEKYICKIKKEAIVYLLELGDSLDIINSYLKLLPSIDINKEYNSKKLNFLKERKQLLIDNNLFININDYTYLTDKEIIVMGYPFLDDYLLDIFKKLNARVIIGEEKCIDYSRNIIDILNIENALNKFNGFILHSSFINWQNNGILFSAPSGTGKSTQADLWNKHENAEIINGDRAGVRNVDGVWSAYGLPVAGSSGIYKNKKAQISHIIVLRQGTENKLTRLSPRDAFIKIYRETTVHTWVDEFQTNILNMISDLVQNVPVYLYECLPDESAVEFLKEQIIKDNKL